MSDVNMMEQAKKAKEFPASTQVAIVNVLPNIANGAFWGFSTVGEMQQYAESLKKDGNVNLRRLGNNVIIEVAPDYLIRAVSAAGPGIIRQQDVDRMNTMSAKAVVEFEKFLLAQGKKGFEGMIGVYCINDTPHITYKGTAYPAFRLPLIQVLRLCQKFKYLVKVKGQWASPEQAMGAGQAMVDSLVMSPTKTGVFMEIKSTATAEELKQYEARMKEGR